MTSVKSIGIIDCVISYDDGKQETITFNNNLLLPGAEALAKILANDYGSTMEFYINRMLFGTNGTIGGVPRVVENTRTGLFGATLLAKPVISSINSNVSTQIICTSVIPSTEGDGNNINEMALEMKNGQLYSMATFGDIAKTSSISLVFNWKISIL